MKLTSEEVLHISRLAKVALTDDEVEQLRGQLSDILDNFEVLKQVDTADVLPTAQSIELCNVMREDEVAPSIPTEEVLSNAPRREGEFFRIRAVLE